MSHRALDWHFPDDSCGNSEFLNKFQDIRNLRIMSELLQRNIFSVLHLLLSLLLLEESLMAMPIPFPVFDWRQKEHGEVVVLLKGEKFWLWVHPSDKASRATLSEVEIAVRSWSNTLQDLMSG